MKRTKTIASGLLVVTIGLTACSVPSSEFVSNAEEVTPTQIASNPQACKLVKDGYSPEGKVNIRTQQVATGLEVPWGIAFLPNKDMLVTERPGRVRLVRNQKLQSKPVVTINVTDSGEGGLLGIAAHPNFAKNRLFYLYYTADKNGSPVNRVQRWRLSQDGRSAAADKMIIDNIPVALYHNGGRLRFGPDGMLYVGTGDARKPETSQDVNSLAGKILRLTPDGQVPKNNPFPGNPVFISGIRNTQGFDWYNKSTLWVTDHGPSGELGRSGHDEVSVAKAGDNLGWSTIYRCQTRKGLVTPSLVWQEAAPPGGAAIYTGNAIPEWRGSLIIATLGAQNLQRVVFKPNSAQIQRHEVYLQNKMGRLREAIVAPDGELYITTSNCDGRGSCPPEQDKIIRVTR